MGNALISWGTARLKKEVVSLLQLSPPKPCMSFYSPSHTLYLSASLIWPPKQYLVGNTYNQTFHYATLSSSFPLLPLRLRYLPQHPQPTVWQTKSHPSDKCQAKLQFCVLTQTKEWLKALLRIIARIPWTYNDLLLSSCMQIWFVSIIPK